MALYVLANLTEQGRDLGIRVLLDSTQTDVLLFVTGEGEPLPLIFYSGNPSILPDVFRARTDRWVVTHGRKWMDRNRSVLAPMLAGQVTPRAVCGIVST